MWKKFRNRSQRSSGQSENDDIHSRQSSPASRIPVQDSRRSSKATAADPPEIPRDVDRWPSERSHISKFDIPQARLDVNSRDLRDRFQDRNADPLGLTVLFSPEHARAADIIFVHGLGGTSRQTWSKGRKPEYFWPKNWLPQEQDICNARILSFGYNANFSSTGPNSISSISDFAKALLFDMKFGKDDLNEDLGIGELPIIFVVHSMGGLVFKKAYLQGLNNPDYKDTADQIQAVLFLSTPHRGTNLAMVLNRILAVSIVGHAPKQYIAELEKNSPAIENLNEDFRNVASRLQIFSFYETLQTSVAVKSMMVLEKDSSILGYPGEISRPLNADHHDVCKFSSREDPNYQSVRSVLGTLVANHHKAVLKTSEAKIRADKVKVRKLLAVTGPPEEDLVNLKNRWRPGTCERILYDPAFIKWTDSTSASHILWAYARPGSGKSIQSSYLINHLLEAGCHCAYYFFKYSDFSKKTLNALLRSTALQAADRFPAFQHLLASLSDDDFDLEKAEYRTIWQKLFTSGLFQLQSPKPLFWVIDALDESDSANALINLLTNITESQIPIRIFVTSRELPSISTAFDRLHNTSVFKISLENNIDDIRCYVETEIRYMHGSNELQQKTIAQIVEQAQGNFLWVYLAVQQIMGCHGPEDFEVALEQLPPGMNAIYHRMEESIAQLPKATDQALAYRILIWAIFSRRPLSVEDLLYVLQPDFKAVFDIRHTISQVCGGFVVIDSSDCVSLIHQTAREYLVNQAKLPFSLTDQTAQEVLFTKSLSSFLDKNVRSRIKGKILPPFYYYAATSWAYHLKLTSPDSDKVLDLLVQFFQGSGVLPWIQALANVGQLKVLVFTSQNLTSFVQRRRKIDKTKMPLLHRISDLSLLEQWAIDLLKLIGKFGGQILQDPSAIYKIVPHFCPHNSVMYRQFGKTRSGPLYIQGVSDPEWDDSIAQMFIGSEVQALAVVSSGRYIAISTSAGTIALWNALTFEKFRTFVHQEHIFSICFSDSGNEMASYGFKTTIIWNVSSGQQISSVVNPLDTRALCIAFTEQDKVLMMGSDTRQIRKLRVRPGSSCWEAPNETIMQEETQLEGTYLNSPTALSFNSGVTELAVAYRGFPLSVWSVTNAHLINRCKRRLNYGQVSNSAWTGVNRVRWHPSSGDVLGIYTDGMVFKWHPIEESHHELKAADIGATPSEIECSPDGIVFATSDVNGTIKIYDFEHFVLLYQLSSEDIITDLCFSPNGRRFYDLRGPICNAWEPNVLIRISEADYSGEQDAEVASTAKSYLASEAFAETPVSITALALNSASSIIVTGNEEGSVELLDIATQVKQQISTSVAGLSIEHLSYAQDGIQIAYCELGGRLTVISTKLSEGDIKTRWKNHNVFKAVIGLKIGGVQQLLSSPESKLLLITSVHSAQLWSIETQSIHTVHTPAKSSASQRWINHPLNPTQLLVFGSQGVKAYQWSSLVELGSWEIDYSQTESAVSDDDHVEKPGLPRKNSSGNPLTGDDRVVESVVSSQNGDYILISISYSASSLNRKSRIQIIPTIMLAQNVHTPITPVSLPPDLVSILEYPLAILGKDRLVFLDSSFWVCTWNLRNKSFGIANSITRHFFLPRDWINSEGLRLCQVLPDGTFLCPRKGEMAIIRSTLGSDW